jgi:hypothetical protein
MLVISEVLMRQHEMQSFEELIALVKLRAKEGEMFIEVDLKPPYPDTPDNYQDALEIAFTSRS